MALDSGRGFPRFTRQLEGGIEAEQAHRDAVGPAEAVLQRVLAAAGVSSTTLYFSRSLPVSA